MAAFEELRRNPSALTDDEEANWGISKNALAATAQRVVSGGFALSESSKRRECLGPSFHCDLFATWVLCKVGGELVGGLHLFSRSLAFSFFTSRPTRARQTRYSVAVFLRFLGVRVVSFWQIAVQSGA